MSPHDHNDRIRPEEERALDALIASQTDTSIDEKTADRLLSFLDADEASAASTQESSAGVKTAADEKNTAAESAARTLPHVIRSRRPLRIAASVAVALAMGAAALLLLYSRPDAPQDDGSNPTIPDAPRSPYVANEAQPNETQPNGAQPNEAVPNGAPRRVTLALRVTGWAKKPAPPAAPGDPVLMAWSGQWVSGLETEDLVREVRSACAVAQPWPAERRSRRAATRMPDPASNPASGLATESLAAMPGVSPREAHRQRALLGTAWLLQRVESRAISREELLEPARLLLAAQGNYRADLVHCFRESRIRIDRMLPSKGRAVPDEVAGLCGALGTPRASRILARATPRAQVVAIVQSLQTGDEASLGFAVDLLLRAHRLTPQFDQRRLAPFDRIDGDVWRVLLHVIQDRASASSSLLERDFLDALRGLMSSKS